MAVTLDRLYTEATSFNNLPSPPTGPKKRVFFVLTYIDPNIKTLSGYPTNPSGAGPFNPDPAIVLKKAAGSIIIPGDPIYAGDVVLDAGDVVEVKNIIAQTGATYVLFDPSPSSEYPNHVKYTIGYTKGDPSVNANPALIPTAGTATLNPSPPKSL
jgi:hypothetical protein